MGCFLLGHFDENARVIAGIRSGQDALERL